MHGGWKLSMFKFSWPSLWWSTCFAEAATSFTPLIKYCNCTPACSSWNLWKRLKFLQLQGSQLSGADTENSERGGRDTCLLTSYIDMLYFAETSIKIIQNFKKKKEWRGPLGPPLQGRGQDFSEVRPTSQNPQIQILIHLVGRRPSSLEKMKH